jgi:hypothetical protein
VEKSFEVKKPFLSVSIVSNVCFVSELKLVSFHSIALKPERFVNATEGKIGDRVVIKKSHSGYSSGIPLSTSLQAKATTEVVGLAQKF